MWQSLLHSGLFSVIGDYIAHLSVLLGADSRWDSNWSHLCSTRALCDAHFHPCSAPRSSVFSCLPAAVASQHSWSIWPLLSCKCCCCFLLILCLPEVFLPLQGFILSRFVYVCKICPSLLSVDGLGRHLHVFLVHQLLQDGTDLWVWVVPDWACEIQDLSATGLGGIAGSHFNAA